MIINDSIYKSTMRAFVVAVVAVTTIVVIAAGGTKVAAAKEAAVDIIRSVNEEQYDDGKIRQLRTRQLDEHEHSFEVLQEGIEVEYEEIPPKEKILSRLPPKHFTRPSSSSTLGPTKTDFPTESKTLGPEYEDADFPTLQPLKTTETTSSEPTSSENEKDPDNSSYSLRPTASPAPTLSAEDVKKDETGTESPTTYPFHLLENVQSTGDKGGDTNDTMATDEGGPTEAPSSMDYTDGKPPVDCTGIFPYKELETLITPFPYVENLSDVAKGKDDLSYVKITVLGTQVCWEDVQSPIPWMELTAGGSNYMHYAFPHWSVNTGLCFVLNEQGLVPPNYAYLTLAECASSNQVFIFDDKNSTAGQIKLLTDPDKCVTWNSTIEESFLTVRPCQNRPAYFFTVVPAEEKKDAEGEPTFHIQAAYNKGLCIGSDMAGYEASVPLRMGECKFAAPLGFIPSMESLTMNLVMEPVVVNFQYTSLGETFMGNPGVQLPWGPRHMVMYPWKKDHCDDGCTQPPDKGCSAEYCVIPCEFKSNKTLCDGAYIDLTEGDLSSCSAELHGFSGNMTNGTFTADNIGSVSDVQTTLAGTVNSTCEKQQLQSKVDAVQRQSSNGGPNPGADSRRNQYTNNTNSGQQESEKPYTPYLRNIEYLGYNTTYNIANEFIRATYNETYNSNKTIPDLGLGENCSGRCKNTSNSNPCSCGTGMAPGCHFLEGYDCMTETSFIPGKTIFVGCNTCSEDQCSPAQPTGTYDPLLIPSGLDIRTCPDNVNDGRRRWGGGSDTIDSKNTATCAVNEECDGEPFVGTMDLSGTRYTFCCPGETSDPFSPLSYGFFGVFPENGHFGPPGVWCDEEGCTYRPVCGCPTSIPALNIKVSGPGRVLPTLYIPRKELVVNNNSAADIQVMPTMIGNSTLRIYTVFKGSDDSFTTGDYVQFNQVLVDAFLDKNKDVPCNERSKLGDVVVPYYQTDSNPYAANYNYVHNVMKLRKNATISFNPRKEWNVLKPPTSIFDNRKIKIRPYIKNGHLWMGPVFVGHPGKTYMGKDPDMMGVFTTVYGRPITGPGSAPGGTTTIATEQFKAFMQCKLSIYSGTEKDPRIVY